MPSSNEIFVYVQPGAKNTEMLGPVEVPEDMQIYGHKEAIKIKIKGQAIEGKANKELLTFLSEQFKIPRRELRITSGETSRYKLIKML